MSRTARWLSWRRIAIRRAISSLGAAATSSPSSRTDPASAGRSREIIPSSVDLPAPLGPMIEVTPPAGISRVTSSTTTVRPYDLRRPWIPITDAAP